MHSVQKSGCHFFLQSALLRHPYFLKSVSHVLWNTKQALILSCCTFSPYSFANFAFTVFQVNIITMVSLLGAHCYNAYCTLLGGQFNIHKLPNLQLPIVKSPFSHLHFYNFALSNHHFHISTFTLQT